MHDRQHVKAFQRKYGRTDDRLHYLFSLACVSVSVCHLHWRLTSLSHSIFFFFWSFLIYIVAATGRQWDERRKNDRQTVDVTLWLHQLKIYDQIVFPWATNLLFHFLSFLLFFFDFLQFVLLCRYNVTYSFDSKKIGREKKNQRHIAGKWVNRCAWCRCRILSIDCIYCILFSFLFKVKWNITFQHFNCDQSENGKCRKKTNWNLRIWMSFTSNDIFYLFVNRQEYGIMYDEKISKRIAGQLSLTSTNFNWQTRKSNFQSQKLLYWRFSFEFLCWIVHSFCFPFLNVPIFDLS